MFIINNMFIAPNAYIDTMALNLIKYIILYQLKYNKQVRMMRG
jgi:hypothetical protein